MPTFLTASECDRIIARELPLGVFPDSGNPSTFYWTAERFAYGTVFATAYSSQQAIYNNFFPQTCDSDNINNWEIKVFGTVNTQGLNLAQRQALILQKLQATNGISVKSIEQVVNFTIPGLTYEVLCWCCGQGEGGWVLDQSQLDLETALNYDTQYSFPLPGGGANLCSATPAQYGLSQQDWINLQTAAYTYQVNIIQTLTTQQYSLLNAALSEFEPARSQHVITDGATQLYGDPLC